MSSPVASASPATRDTRLRGYAEIAASSLILGTSATLIQVSTMPASLLLVTRMGLAGVVLGVVFFLSGGVEEVRRSGRLRRMIVVGFVVALEMIFYFSDGLRYIRVEHAGVLGYLEPVTAPLWAFLLVGEAPPWTTYAAAPSSWPPGSS